MAKPAKFIKKKMAAEEKAEKKMGKKSSPKEERMEYKALKAGKKIKP